jgi:hypothetical protein
LAIKLTGLRNREDSFSKRLTGTKSLIIIPDQFLALPFETTMPMPINTSPPPPPLPTFFPPPLNIPPPNQMAGMNYIRFRPGWFYFYSYLLTTSHSINASITHTAVPTPTWRTVPSPSTYQFGAGGFIPTTSATTYSIPFHVQPSQPQFHGSFPPTGFTFGSSPVLYPQWYVLIIWFMQKLRGSFY